jgi:hypothetical protein
MTEASISSVPSTVSTDLSTAEVGRLLAAVQSHGRRRRSPAPPRPRRQGRSRPRRAPQPAPAHGAARVLAREARPPGATSSKEPSPDSRSLARRSGTCCARWPGAAASQARLPAHLAPLLRDPPARGLAPTCVRSSTSSATLAPQHGALHLRVAQGAEPRAESPRYRREWVVYAKRPFGGSAQVVRYPRPLHPSGWALQRRSAKALAPPRALPPPHDPYGARLRKPPTDPVYLPL